MGGPMMDRRASESKGQRGPELSTELPETELELSTSTAVRRCFGCLASRARQHCVLIHSPPPRSLHKPNTAHLDGQCVFSAAGSVIRRDVHKQQVR